MNAIVFPSLVINVASQSTPRLDEHDETALNDDTERGMNRWIEAFMLQSYVSSSGSGVRVPDGAPPEALVDDGGFTVVLPSGTCVECFRPARVSRS